MRVVKMLRAIWGGSIPDLESGGVSPSLTA